MKIERERKSSDLGNWGTIHSKMMFGIEGNKFGFGVLTFFFFSSILAEYKVRVFVLFCFCVYVLKTGKFRVCFQAKGLE